MGIYRGAGGTGDATADSASEALLIRDLVDDAELAEANAANSATAAANSATAAANSATAASGSASTASTQATNASNSATAAATSATNAANSAASITGDVAAAEAAQVAASASASAAASSASAASTSASNAATSATNASNSASSASTSATNASNSATAAATSATNASNSATSASTSASTATTQASNASTSASNAATSATAAQTAETNAETAETNAASSASAASTSATNASNSASAASTSASNAATSATNAANSATAAAGSATTASSAADAALAALDSFDDRYLGQKSTAPTVDNDGNALVTGALYFNTTSNEMKVWDGSQWLNAYASLSGALIAANNLSDLTNTSTARTNLGLGTAATTAATDYATAAQGTKADSALQPAAIGVSVQAYDADLATIAGLTPTNNYAIIGNGTSWTSSALPASGVTDVTGTSPVVSSGGATPAISLASGYGDTQNPYASKTANFVLAAPNGSSGAPTFRAVVAADIPTLNQNTTGTAANVTGTVAIANGGTGQTTRQAAMDALAGAVTAGQYLRGDGTDVVMSAIQAADVPTLNQNTTGSAASVSGTSSNGFGTRTVSTSSPTGGSNGDIWYKV